MNDRPDIAAMVGAAGVHVGQDDLPVEDARKICKPPAWVGVSTHNLDQFREAELTSADYIAVGPIFPTATKENPDPVVGLELLRRGAPVDAASRWWRLAALPQRAPLQCICAGADSVAVIRDLRLRVRSGRAGSRIFWLIAERVRLNALLKA